jgi:hypothetical protein
VAQVLLCLPSKCEALSSKPLGTQKKETKLLSLAKFPHVNQLLQKKTGEIYSQSFHNETVLYRMWSLEKLIKLSH